jgi:hypothetical protein
MHFQLKAVQQEMTFSFTFELQALYTIKGQFFVVNINRLLFLLQIKGLLQCGL